MSISTRVLRKFADDNLVNKPPDDGSDIDETPYSAGAKKKQVNVNPFDLLNDQSPAESEDREYNDDSDQEITNDNGNSNVSKDMMKKKKKKKKKKALKNNQRHSSEDIDEVERSVQEVNAILGDSVKSLTTVENSHKEHNKKKGIINVEYKHLNPKTELKRIFGNKIIQSQQCKRRDHIRRNLKNTCLVPPRDNWPPVNKVGLSMNIVKTENEIQYFTYEHSSNYQNMQKLFLDAVESLSSDNIMSVINLYPYHVDTLIQLSDIFKLRDELPMAAELIERALYALESAFHPLFSVTKGNSRLDYRRQENRGFFIALFKHLTFVGQRACYRTALEFCKLIFSLDPENDPLAIVLTIDFYALRSREFDWFLQFVEILDHERNLSQLPNIAFSKAVALFQLSDPSSNSVLQDALLMFPSVLFPLLSCCGVEPDSKTQTHSYFSNSSCRPSALNLLVQLYVQRNYHIWKEPDTLSWLEKNTLEVLKRVDNNDPLVSEYAEKRARRFEAKTPREIARHVYLSDIKKVTSILLAESSDFGVLFSFDPFPPLDSVNIYSRRELNFSNTPEGVHAYLQNSLRDTFNAMRNLISFLAPVDSLDSSNENEEEESPF